MTTKRSIAPRLGIDVSIDDEGVVVIEQPSPGAESHVVRVYPDDVPAFIALVKDAANEAKARAKAARVQPLESLPPEAPRLPGHETLFDTPALAAAAAASAPRRPARP